MSDFSHSLSTKNKLRCLPHKTREAAQLNFIDASGLDAGSF